MSTSIGRTLRRCLRFRTRTMLIVVAGLCMLLGWNVNQSVREQRSARAIERIGGFVVWGPYRYGELEPGGIRRVRQLFGADWGRAVREVHAGKAGAAVVPHLGSLGRVEELYLERDDLRNLDRPPHLPKLQLLRLNSSILDQKMFRWMSELETLEILDLRHTNISDSDLADVGRLVNLRKLDLEATNISDEGLKHLSALVNLQQLNVSRTNVSFAGLVHLLKDIQNRSLDEALHVIGHQMVEDTGVALSDLNVNDKDLETLVELKRLGGLALENSAITDKGLGVVEHFPELETLGLCNTGITDAGLGHLQRLTNLRTLVLSGTKITNAGLQHLSNLNGLESLYLSNTSISDSGLSHLRGLSSLKLLDLAGTQVTESGVTTLREVLPNTLIVMSFIPPQ